MVVLFLGRVRVTYSQMHIVSTPMPPGTLHRSFTGQANGLCGAAIRGELHLITGLHTGRVIVSAQAHDAEPPLDDDWEEIVEVSFRPVSGDVRLKGRGGGSSAALNLAPTDHRVRYHVAGMEAGRWQDTRLNGEPEVDLYFLQFWPAPPAPDRLVKQTSQTAGYWHDWARAPDAPTTARRRDRGLRKDP